MLQAIDFFRTFIAINIEEEVKKELVLLINKLRNNDDKINWVREESLHLTLKFLGNVSMPQIEAIYKQLKLIAGKVTSFKISLSSLGVFPNERRPQVIWVGIKEGHDKLRELVWKVEDSLESMGFLREEKEHIPHLTIGRIKRIKNKNEFIERIKKVSISKFNYFLAKKIEIMKSNLTPKGAIYTSLKEILLKDIDILI